MYRAISLIHCESRHSLPLLPIHFILMKTLSILLPSRKDRCIISHGRMNAKAIRLLHNEGQILSHTEHPSLSVQPMVLGTQQISAIIDFHRVEAAFPAVRIYFLTKTRNGSAVWKSSSCPWHWPSQHAHTASSTETAIRDTSWGNFISCLNFQRSQTLICHQKKKKKGLYSLYYIHIQDKANIFWSLPMWDV